MKNHLSERCLHILVTVLPALAVLLFFSLVEPSHLRFQEQNQMFLFTSSYLKGLMNFPGAPAVYAGRFLTQFFISPAAGALVIALMFALVHWLVYTVIGNKSLQGRVLALIPGVLAALYMCDENALMSVFVAVAAGLAAALPFRHASRGAVHAVAAVAVAIGIYLLCGPLGALVFSISAAVCCRCVYVGLGCAAAAFAACLVCTRLCDYPFIRLLTGPHYSRYHDTVPLLPWLAAAGIAAVAMLQGLLKKTLSKVLSISIFIFLMIGFMLGFSVRYDADMEEMLEYSSLTCRQDWEGVMKLASRKEPVNPVNLSCLNLALAQTGRMGEWMFRFRQAGRDGLFYPYRREHISPVPSSMVYWSIGSLNSAQRFTFAAQEVIPDYQKSAWCHKRLAEIYLVNGEYDVARKNLEPLKYTLFYRRWALSFEKFLDDTSLIDADPVYGAERKLMLKEHNSTYNIEDMDTPLSLLCKENPRNHVAYQYLLALSLLEKDLDRFAGHFSAEGFGSVPAGFQEAYLLWWSQDHDGPEGLPAFVTQRVVDRFMRFSNDLNTRDEQYVWSRYQDTYWFYYFFRNLDK